MKVDSQSTISPSQAHYVLAKLLSEKRVSKAEVASYLGQMDSEIRDLEARLAMLRETRNQTPAVVPSRVAPARKARARKRRARPAAAPGVVAVPEVKAEAKPGRARAKAKRRRRSRKAASAPPTNAQIANSQQLQGKYLSLIRQIAKERRSVYQQVALQQGREEAINMMRSELKK